MGNIRANNINKFKKWVIIILLDLFVIFAIVWYVVATRPFHHEKINIAGVYLDQPSTIGEFNMVDQEGKLFTQKQLKGHWTFLLFGFTHCPKVCPTTLAALENMMVILQQRLPDRLLPQVVFITVDPKRDNVEKLKRFVTSYNPRFIGVRDESNSFPGANINKGIDHTTDILLINPQAQIQAYFLYPHDPEKMAKDYQLILNTTVTVSETS